jgi:hypothetical protein
MNAQGPKAISMDDPNFNMKSMVQSFAQKQFDDMMAVKVDFKRDGTAFFKGETSSLGFSKGGDGRWEVVRHDGDILFVRMSQGDEAVEARLEFSGTEAFILKRTDMRNMSPLLFTAEK